MRFLLFMTITFVLSLTSILPAKVWRVNNNGVSADFTTAQQAADGAAAGDTLYFEGSGASYGDMNISKKLVIIGPGYYLDKNGTYYLNNNTASIGNVNLQKSPLASAASSVIMGVSISNLSIAADNILIFKNWIQKLNFTDAADGVKIQQNFIQNGNINITNSKNLVFKNNIVLGCSFQGIVNTTYNHNITNNLFVTSQLQQNSYDAWVRGVIFINNIFYNSNLINPGDNFMNNNITDGSWLPQSPGDGNQNNVSMSSIMYMSYSSSPDGQYQLMPAPNAARATGMGGVDMGPFGGDTPYVLSGVTPIPSIYYLNTSGVGTNQGGLPVQIKAKGNK